MNVAGVAVCALSLFPSWERVAHAGAIAKRAPGEGARRLQYLPAVGYTDFMTKLLRDAIKQVEQLPDGEQDAAAAAMLDYLAHRQSLRVSDEDLAEIRRRRADPNAKRLTLDEFDERLRRLTGA